MQGRTRRGGGPKLTKYQKQRIMGRPKIKTNKSNLLRPPGPGDKKKRFRTPQKADVPPIDKGGSPNQKFKDEQKKKRELRVKNRNINRPGTDPVKTPTGVNRPGTDIKKKNKIKSLSGDFIKKVLMFGLPIGPAYFATEQLYKEFLKKKKMKT
tara:strand:- start:248 stop:706 length:459 start_codon:yes stop_codon:yes gene_type:complete